MSADLFLTARRVVEAIDGHSEEEIVSAIKMALLAIGKEQLLVAQSDLCQMQVHSAPLRDLIDKKSR